MFHPLAVSGYLWLAWLVYWFVASRSASRRKFKENYLSRLAHSLPLTIGMILIYHGSGVAAFHHRLIGSFELRWVGVALTAAGLLFSVWARVHLGRNWSGFVSLKADHKLIRTGPYRFVRHPIYTGLLIAAIGGVLVADTPDGIIGFALVLLAFSIKIRREELLLTQEFGDEYLAFKQNVPALVPLLF